MKSIFNSQALTLEKVPSFMTLQAEVLGALGRDQAHFITPRDALMIEIHLKMNMPIIGLHDVADNTLIGAVIVSHPDVTRKYNEMNPMIAGLYQREVAIIEGLYISPRFQKNGLGTRLVFEAATLAVDNGRAHLSAEIAVENVASCRTFAKNGFDEISRFVCPDDGAHVMSMQANAQTVVQTSQPAKLRAYTR